MLHHLRTEGISAATQKHFNIAEDEVTNFASKFINRLNGYINFIGQVCGVEDSIYWRMKRDFANQMDIVLFDKPSSDES